MKSFAVLLTVFVVLVSFLPMTLSHGAVSFNDVPKDAWYYEHVQYVATIRRTDGGLCGKLLIPG